MTVFFYKASLFRSGMPNGSLSGFIDISNDYNAKEVAEEFDRVIGNLLSEEKQKRNIEDRIRWSIDSITPIN